MSFPLALRSFGVVVNTEGEDELLNVVVENKLLNKFFALMRRSLVLGAEEFIIHINVEDKIFNFKGEFILLVDTEEDNELHDSSSTNPLC